jgi:hypothetical protein
VFARYVWIHRLNETLAHLTSPFHPLPILSFFNHPPIVKKHPPDKWDPPVLPANTSPWSDTRGSVGPCVLRWGRWRRQRGSWGGRHRCVGAGLARGSKHYLIKCSCVYRYNFEQVARVVVEVLSHTFFGIG